MAYLEYRKIKRKNGTKTDVYICETRTIYDDNGKKKTSRKRQRIGILNETITKKEAATALAFHESKGIGIKKVTLMMILNEFREHLGRELSLNNIKENTYKAHLCNSKHLGSLYSYKMDEIKFKHIEHLKLRISRTLRPRTVNLVLLELNKCYKYAIKNGYTTYCPPIVKMSDPGKKEIHKFNDSEIHQLLSTENKNLKFYIRVLISTGMRPNEFFNLERNDVDHKNHTIRIKSDRKNKRGRVILVPPAIRSDLYKRCKEFIRISPYKSLTGGSNTFHRWCKSLGLKDGYRRLRVYTLRNTFISKCLEDGWDQGVLCSYTGTSPLMIQKHYLNLAPKTPEKYFGESSIEAIVSKG